MENSKIEWCDHTANFWSGCTKKSPACAHCYAEALSRRAPKTLGGFGPGAPRRDHRESARKNLIKWNRNAIAVWLTAGKNPHRPRVFINSLSDWLDDEVPVEWLWSLLETVKQCKSIDHLLLTKRPELFRSRMEAIHRAIPEARRSMDWWLGGGVPENVWVGATVEDQARADERVPHLLKIPAKVRFLSCEPLLEPLSLERFGEWAEPQDGGYFYIDGIHWLICGGESGTKRRPFHADWARDLRDLCRAAGVAFFMKQMSGLRSDLMPPLPEDLMIREFPTPTCQVP